MEYVILLEKWARMRSLVRSVDMYGMRTCLEPGVVRKFGFWFAKYLLSTCILDILYFMDLRLILIDSIYIERYW